MPWENPEDGRPRGGWGGAFRRRSGGPPDPLHRAWFHPSELAGLLAPDADTPRPTAPSTRHGASVTAGLFVAAATALATLLTVLGTGTGTRGGGTHLFASVTFPTETTQALTVLAASAAANVVAILTTDSDDELRRIATGIPIGDGEVVTCADLLEGATDLRVLTASGRELEATVVSTDPATDLAVLRVKGTLASARLGSTKDLERGDPVVMITAGVGSRSVAPSLQESVVLATNRMASTRAASLVGLIETDQRPARSAAGAALLDRKGAVVGILTDTREDNGFALPIEVVRNVADQLVATGAVRRGWLGITVEDDSGVVRVHHVTAGGPAGRAGVAEGDVIFEAGDVSIRSVGDLMAALQRQRPGDPFRMKLLRGNERIRAQARLDLADTTTVVRTAGLVTG